MFILRLLAAFLATASTVALAQPADAPPRDDPPRRPDIARLLNLDATRAAKVEAILRAQREKMHALREETDRQLATVLTAAELEKLHQALPRPPGPPRH
jgi:Spy/CpxP family protein refolding chaperone